MCFVIIYICVKNGEKQLRDHSNLKSKLVHIPRLGGTGFPRPYSVSAGIEFVKETLIPGVDAIFKDLLNRLKQAVFPEALVRG